MTEGGRDDGSLGHRGKSAVGDAEAKERRAVVTKLVEKCIVKDLKDFEGLMSLI